MGVLVATLVTIGLMTKTGELLVMRACGISLYRSALPLLVFGFLASGVLFMMQERVLASANREADSLERVIRHYPPAMNALNRRWIVGHNGEMYHYDFFDPAANQFSNLVTYALDDDAWRLRTVTRANRVSLERTRASDGHGEDQWVATGGWTRDISEIPEGAAEAPVKYTPFTERTLPLEPPSYFKSEEPIAEMMTYLELRDHIARLQASGANVVPQMVALQRKIAFPFVTVVMTILAVPFAVTTGRRGTMFGIGIGIVMAITYWVTLSVAGALGSGGVLTPVLAAWAPNILFGAAAVYMVLTVRT
jgi:lipopolysaccharide export LptBFGC system permease protein LptF